MPSRHSPDVHAYPGLQSLSWLSPAQLERLAQGLSVREVKKRQVIFQQGDPADRLYVLLSGVARLSLRNTEGQQVLVSLLGTGEVFGSASLLPGTKRPFRCDAFTDCRVGTVRPETFVNVSLGVPFEDFARVAEVTVGRWWAMVLRYAHFVGLGLRERLAAALLELAAKFGVEDARGTILTLRVTHADLAELVGASRQRVTEQVKDFERSGLLMREGRRLILAVQKLRAVA